MEEQELLKKIQMIIKKQKVSKEVKKAVDKIYREYQDSYRKLLSNLEQAMGKNSKYLTELNQIASYMKQDYEGDYEMSIEIEDTSYAMKVDSMLEKVTNAINSILNSENSSQKLGAIIDVEELTEEEKERRDRLEKEKIIRESTKSTIANKNCAKEIVESIIVEIDSSKDSIMLKVSSNMKNAPNIDYIKMSQLKFKEEIEVIKKEAREKLEQQIKEALDAQDNEIANEIIDSYSKYKEIRKPLTKREKFASDLQVKVNSKEAIQRVQEAKKQEKQEEKLESLPPIL